MDLELTDAEVVHMNNYCVETSEVTGKSYKKIEPEVGGSYHLNGVQAVSYARIRYTDGCLLYTSNSMNFRLIR